MTRSLACLMLAMTGGFCTAGCTPLGPQTIPRDRMDYSAGIGDSWQQQQLLNVVKLRYADAPIFLDVGQVVSGYTIESSIYGNLTYTPQIAPDPYHLSTGAGSSGRYAENPTISYTPLTGATFIKSLMTPIPPAALLYAIEGGWPADLIFRTSVMAVNGISNRRVTGSYSRAGDPRFYRLVELLRNVQAEDALRIQVTLDKDKNQATVMTFTKHRMSSEAATAVAEVQSILGLPSDKHVFRAYYGEDPLVEGDLAMLTRSLLQIMMALSSYIDVPQSHIDAGRTVAAPVEDEVEPLIRIHCGQSRPKDAFVTVPYRGCWYWIDDGDFKSKRIFSFMMLLYSLAETGDKTAPPIITIPAR